MKSERRPSKKNSIKENKKFPYKCGRPLNLRTYNEPNTYAIVSIRTGEVFEYYRSKSTATQDLDKVSKQNLEQAEVIKIK